MNSSLLQPGTLIKAISGFYYYDNDGNIHANIRWGEIGEIYMVIDMKIKGELMNLFLLSSKSQRIICAPFSGDTFPDGYFMILVPAKRTSRKKHLHLR